MLRKKLFDGVEQEWTVYNAQAAVNIAIDFFLDDQDCDSSEEESYTFPGFASAYFRVYNERGGRLIKDLDMTQNGSELVLNASAADMTFEDLGNYIYEIGYVNVVYEIVLMYGVLRVI